MATPEKIRVRAPAAVGMAVPAGLAPGAQPPRGKSPVQKTGRSKTAPAAYYSPPEPPLPRASLLVWIIAGLLLALIRPSGPAKVYVFRMTGIMALAAGAVLAMSATAMWRGGLT